MPAIDYIIASELRRRCLKSEDIEVEPVLWSAATEKTYEISPGGVFYLLDKAYGMEYGVAKLSGIYNLRSDRTAMSISFANAQLVGANASVLAQAAPWSYDSTTLHEGAMAIEVTKVFGGASWTLNLQFLVVHVREGRCESC